MCTDKKYTCSQGRTVGSDQRALSSVVEAVHHKSQYISAERVYHCQMCQQIYKYRSMLTL